MEYLVPFLRFFEVLVLARELLVLLPELLQLGVVSARQREALYFLLVLVLEPLDLILVLGLKFLLEVHELVLRVFFE